uniref:Putative ankyrin repeat and SAM domain-containing protein 6-like n=1 Tax=Davidia involucrata TaxID=16924 RepID=A0A5B7AE95_DAVIN
MAELQPPEGQINGGALVVVSTENLGTKRQRRPSVRLGDIGDQPYDSHVNRRTKQWRLPMNDSGKSSKTRALMNLGGAGDYHETLDGEDREGNLDSVAIGSWKVKDSKSKRGFTTKRVRSNWVSKVDEGGGGGVGIGEGDEKFSGGEYVDDGFRDFDPEGSESPLKEQSPIHSLDNMAVDTDRGHFHGHRRGVRGARVSESRGHHDGVELDGPSDTDARNWNNSERDGVRVWLNQLGLGRYAPVFEIHEVDDEVLPLLTLEDLKDMGINAVGSRRKMYCAIQKLGKGFS